MPATLTTVNALLKELYQGQLRDQLQSDVIGYKRIESTNRGISNEVGGKYVTFPIRVRRNHGQGYRQENEQLPAAGQQGYTNVRIPLKYGYGRVRLTGQLMKLAETNAQAFANAMQKEMDGLKDDVAKDCGRIFYGDAVGTLATITADGVNTVTVSAADAARLELDMLVDAITPGTGAVKFANRKITAINLGTGVVTYDGADAAAVATDVLVRTGSGTVSAGVFREPNGLNSLVAATGALYNVDPATEPKWAATVDDMGGGATDPLTELKMIQMVDKARIQGGKTSVIFTSLGVYRAYWNILQAFRQFVNTQDFDGGLKGLGFAADNREIPVVSDVDAPANIMWGLQEDNFTVYRESDWEFADDDGSVLKWVHDFDAWEAVLRRYWEIGIDRRNSHWKLHGITES